MKEPLSSTKPVAWGLVALLGLAASVAAWAYFPAGAFVLEMWLNEPDYSHGILVPGIVAYLLWARRANMPAVAGPGWGGLVVVLFSIGMRFVAGWFAVEALDAWSALVWLWGVAWVIFGFAWFRWAFPALAFLAFSIPVPFRVETFLSLPLQNFAATASTWTLQLLGEPAMQFGNTIQVGDHHLEVANACSGLRIFISIAAVAYLFVMYETSWLKKLLLVLSVAPIALLANMIRIVVTGVLFQRVSGEAARHFSHDLAGYVMIPLAAGFFFLVLWYIDRLVVRDVESSLSEVMSST